jgi:hypothetical protein
MKNKIIKKIIDYFDSNKRIEKGKIKDAKYYELLALSRMTGEQILNELNEREKKEYSKYLE